MVTEGLEPAFLGVRPRSSLASCGLGNLLHLPVPQFPSLSNSAASLGISEGVHVLVRGK